MYCLRRCLFLSLPLTKVNIFIAMFWKCVPLIYPGIFNQFQSGIVLFLKPASSHHNHHSQCTELEFSLEKES